MRALFFIVFIFSLDGIAATVQNIKNQKVLIVLSGQSVHPDEKFFLLDAKEKKRRLFAFAR